MLGYLEAKGWLHDTIRQYGTWSIRYDDTIRYMIRGQPSFIFSWKAGLPRASAPVHSKRTAQILSLNAGLLRANARLHSKPAAQPVRNHKISLHQPARKHTSVSTTLNTSRSRSASLCPSPDLEAIPNPQSDTLQAPNPRHPVAQAARS